LPSGKHPLKGEARPFRGGRRSPESDQAIRNLSEASLKGLRKRGRDLRRPGKGKRSPGVLGRGILEKKPS
jgi:hypothetical protein